MEEIKTKRCSECGQIKPVTEFYRRRQRNGELSGYQHTCKACAATIRRRYFKPHSKIRYQLKLTQEQVDAIIAPQKCECCGAGPEARLCIDHDHDTKKPRSLLCHKCNTALGLLNDNAARIVDLAHYITRHSAQ